MTVGLLMPFATRDWLNPAGQVCADTGFKAKRNAKITATHILIVVKTADAEGERQSSRRIDFMIKKFRCTINERTVMQTGGHQHVCYYKNKVFFSE